MKHTRRLAGIVLCAAVMLLFRAAPVFGSTDESAPVLGLVYTDRLQPAAGAGMTAIVVCDGEPERVELYDGAALLGADDDSGDGFRFELDDLPAGVWQLYAIAVYPDGSVRKSAVREVSACGWDLTPVNGGSGSLTLSAAAPTGNLYGVSLPADLFLMDITYRTSSAASHSNIQPWDQPASGGSNATVLTVQDGAFWLMGADIAAPCERNVPYRIRLLVDRTAGTMQAEIRNMDTDTQIYFASGLTVPAAVQNLRRVKVEELSADAGISTAIGLDIYNLSSAWDGVVLQSMRLTRQDMPDGESLRLPDIAADPSAAVWHIAVANGTGTEAAGRVILAVYSGSGALIGYAQSDALHIPPGEGTEIDIPMPAVPGEELTDAKVQVFLFDGIETIRPLSQSRSV